MYIVQLDDADADVRTMGRVDRSRLHPNRLVGPDFRRISRLVDVLLDNAMMLQFGTLALCYLLNDLIHQLHTRTLLHMAFLG